MPVPKLLPSQEYLQECLDYDPVTGLLVWNERPLSHFKNWKGHKVWNVKFPGKEVGCIVVDKRHGYTSRVVSLDAIKYKASRLIYKLVANEEHPEIDHADNNPLNMCWINLRGCTHSQNIMNTAVRCDSVSGFRGVSYSSIRIQNPYQAYIIVNKKFTSLGCYPTAEKAHAAYCEAGQRLHGEFHRP